MEFNIEVRKKQLGSLHQYIKSSRENVEVLLGKIGWNSNKLLEHEEPRKTCTYNRNHLVYKNKYSDHLAKCKIQSEGYCPTEQFLSEPTGESSTSIKLEDTEKIRIFNASRTNNHHFKTAWNGHNGNPRTSDRYMSTFSVDERLTLYDYAVQNTEKPPVPEEFNLTLDQKKSDGEFTEEELLRKERDLKRRRIKYKSVHTNKKSHTEIMKEVIKSQMEQYKDWLTEQEPKPVKEEPKDPADVDNHSTEVIVKHDDILERPHSSVSSRHSSHSNKRSTNNGVGERHEHSYRQREENNKRRSRSHERWRRRGNSHDRQRYNDRSNHDKKEYSHSSSRSRHSYDKHKSDRRYDDDRYSRRSKSNYHR